MSCSFRRHFLHAAEPRRARVEVDVEILAPRIMPWLVLTSVSCVKSFVDFDMLFDLFARSDSTFVNLQRHFKQSNISRSR